MQVSMTINGKVHTAEVDDNTFLVDFIRQNCGMTGTHVGCDTGQCGACVVHMDGVSVKSCVVLAASAEGCAIATIESMSHADGSLGVIQQAFQDHHGLQCGFCTPGMVMTAAEILRKHKNPTQQQIREQLEGNLCRCTGYHNIAKAIEAAAQQLNG